MATRESLEDSLICGAAMDPEALCRLTSETLTSPAPDEHVSAYFFSPELETSTHSAPLGAFGPPHAPLATQDTALVTFQTT